MPAAMVPAMPAAALQHLTATLKPWALPLHANVVKSAMWHILCKERGTGSKSRRIQDSPKMSTIEKTLY